MHDIRRKLGRDRRERIQGIGIAAPLSLGGWQALLGVPADIAAKWHALRSGAASRRA